MLVAGTTTALILVAEMLVRKYMVDDLSIQTDPIRIFEAIIGGVSFLGAGTILRRERGGVEGLTTAASLLFVCTIGTAVALELWVIAAGSVLLTLVVLRGVDQFFD